MMAVMIMLVVVTTFMATFVTALVAPIVIAAIRFTDFDKAHWLTASAVLAAPTMPMTLVFNGRVNHHGFDINLLRIHWRANDQLTIRIGTQRRTQAHFDRRGVNWVCSNKGNGSDHQESRQFHGFLQWVRFVPL
jgi:hypothetical protein